MKSPLFARSSHQTVSVCLLSGLIVCGYSSSRLRAQTEWTLPEVVIPMGEADELDSCFVNSPRVVRDEHNGGYKLFFIGGGPTLHDLRILTWASSGALKGPWEKSGEQVLADFGLAEPEFVLDPTGDGFRAYCTIEEDASCRVRVAVTDDIESEWDWSPEAPFLPELDWESSWVSSFSHVLVESEGTSEHHMWYWAGDVLVDSFHIGRARSRDGDSWERHREPVLSFFEGAGVGHPRVLYHENSCSFELWYVQFGGPGGGQLGIAYATSLDGVEWTRQGPVYDPIPANPRQPFVIFEPEEAVYHLWFDETDRGQVDVPQCVTSGPIWYATARWTIPRASFTVKDRGDGRYEFDAELSVPPPPQKIESYRWEIVDNSIAGLPRVHLIGVDPVVRQTFSWAGSYLIRLTVTAGDRTGSVARRIEVTESAPRFLRGDCDANGLLDINDPVANLFFQFVGTFEPPCEDALDFDDSGLIDVTDPIGNLTHQFLDGPPPAVPGNEACGVDPIDDELGCESFAVCDV